ncbi:hypothetical protein [Candidatus Mycoplasma haematominutum]|uniref:Uncharacterized protein n=1 Tax=Candidatus Mycoplasma haematominutum 'Birmingham 1' TaxID=1116213 RepID=G8C3U3_9MOLU|nr:hypothetical protein [Candidatus Mycoplasma haematominutum]CCE66991.1 hypothetical protein MHM_04730 [Candidatus Mycoplasma haematominutum 'Birmingham 1']
MTVTSRVVLGTVTSVAGVSSAVGVPLALSAGSAREFGLQGGDVSKVSVDISKCKNSEAKSDASVEFGSSTANHFCWRTQNNDQFSTSDEYTQFFKEQWSVSDQNWGDSSNQGRWNKQCLNGNTSNPWVILVESSGNNYGAHHLGLCGESQIESTKFVKKKQVGVGASNTWELWACSNHCWTIKESTLDSSPKVLSREKENNWSKIEFYSKSVTSK